jgi:hypothetical protein
MRYRHIPLPSVVGIGLTMAAVTAFGASPATAQAAADGFSLGLAGGFARGSASPFGTSSLGYYVLTALEFPTPVRAFRPRLDGFFADWGSGHVEALTGNVLFTPISGKRVAPYALIGAGAYSTGATPKAGWTMGAGLRLPGEFRAIVVESRVHAFLRAGPTNVPPYYPSRWQYMVMPIGLGIQF